MSDCAVFMEAPRMTRKQQAQMTRKKLLEVSLRLVREQGFDHVKISDICREADVSTGAFYHHLKSKAGIVVESYAQCDEFFREKVYPRFKDAATVEGILGYIDCQMQYAVDIGVDICIQIYKAQLTEGTEFFLSQERALPAGLIKVIGHLQAEGVLKKEKSAGEIGEELLVITRGVLYHWCQCRGDYDLGHFARELVQNYLKAYTK